jgi:hypothetical protein
LPDGLCWQHGPVPNWCIVGRIERKLLQSSDGRLTDVEQQRETESEFRARQVIENALDRRLERFRIDPGRPRPTPDYTDEYNEAFEVKCVTSPELRHLRDRVQRQRWFASTALAMHWSVAIQVPTMGDKFRPTPDFPDDDPAQIAALVAEGFAVTPKADRETEWAMRFAGQKRSTPSVQRLPPALEPHLLALEHAGIRNTRGAQPQTPRERYALTQIARLTHGAICLAHVPVDGRAGIELVLGYGYARTGRPDALASRVQAWLDSELSSNLRQSLWPEFAIRHAVLVFDPSEPEYWSAQRDPDAFVPQGELELPPEIDVLWCMVGRCLLHYESGPGWRTSALS